MKRSRAFTFIVPLLFMIGCASSGIKKPTVFIDQHNNIPADIPSQFDSRYEQFISDKEMEAFHKLQTDEERQAFQDKFWLERDTNPTTPENEYKQEIDERIDDIANERFLNTPGVFGLLFRSNGGFRGDMAQTYLLHGEPDAMDTIEGRSFVPMMLWVYANPENGNIRYAFLFYQKGGRGLFKLFFQGFYRMNPCGAIYEVATLRLYGLVSSSQDCPDDLNRVYNDIYSTTGRGGILDGNIFTWALFNFSQDGSVSQETALDPPKPALETAKQSNARVVGEAVKLTGTAGTDFILASCKECKSFMPAELRLGKRFTISGPWKNFDWTVKGEYLELSLKYGIIIESSNIGKPTVLKGVVVWSEKKSLLDESPEVVLTFNLLDPEQVAVIPPGTYQASVYVKNTLTQKYNAWSKEFTK
ncbi:MAG: hypothetical protein A3C69_00420 [Candidatus Yanofskybacteria bacterium RIFCSPHIGHO2_02_FULL_43_12]|uniref:GWxTD domain-containing protein n=2 Tax=Parcubacteria group TaxID=1794811 RepID=A0A1G2RPS1_9BACT|nr:MAG: hypothetical protein A3C69_00420 [Candidatus Yanofskybacteria bacterium RIFCSPHIGHO2_02_FULL_43_12]OHA74854.1 MAG: hypothetical protein A3A32_03325 [Candidatus Wildermuthbacteria bacterium RIFCSPLOWO2_01_FULL_48_35]